MVDPMRELARILGDPGYMPDCWRRDPGKRLPKPRPKPRGIKCKRRVCTNRFHRKGTGRRREYCSRECSKIAWYRKKSANKRRHRKAARTCRRCGKSFVTPGRRGRLPMYCGKVCSNAATQERMRRDRTAAGAKTAP